MNVRYCGTGPCAWDSCLQTVPQLSPNPPRPSRRRTQRDTQQRLALLLSAYETLPRGLERVTAEQDPRDRTRHDGLGARRSDAEAPRTPSPPRRASRAILSPAARRESQSSPRLSTADEDPMPDRVRAWDPSSWNGDDAKPEELGAEDLLDLNRFREYVRGRRYEVFVPSPFPRGEPILRARYFVRWETRDGERWPIFATEEEWLEVRLHEQTTALRTEGYRPPEQWMTLKEIAAEVGKDARTIHRHIVERGECAFTEFGRTKKVRRSDFEAWLAKDRHVAPEVREADSYRRSDF